VGIHVHEFISLDGVIDTPSWTFDYGFDPRMGETIGRLTGDSDAILLGRRTYEAFFAVWPKRTDNRYTEVLNRTRKYVASTTLTEPLPWENSTLLAGDAADAVARLREEREGDLAVLGSGALVRSLAAGGLVDEYLLSIHPLVLGTGRRLFDGVSRAGLRLADAVTTTTGVIIATYHPAT
jgi:dihydrofolate reductase